MANYGALARKLAELKQLTQTHAVPSKAHVKRAASQNPFVRRDNQLLASLPGSSRSHTLNTIKGVAAKETGCITRREPIPLAVSQRNSNTTVGNYNQTVRH